MYLRKVAATASGTGVVTANSTIVSSISLSGTGNVAASHNSFC